MCASYTGAISAAVAASVYVGMVIRWLERGRSPANQGFDASSGGSAAAFERDPLFPHPANELAQAPLDLTVHAALGQGTRRLLRLSMPVEGVDEVVDPVTPGRTDEDDVRAGGEGGRRHSGAVGNTEHPEELGAGALGRFAHVGLVDHEKVRNFHDPRLQELKGVARPGLDDEHHRVDHVFDVRLALADADGLDEDAVERGRKHHDGRGGGSRQASELAGRGQRSHEEALVVRIGVDAGTVAEKGSSGSAARWVDRKHADRKAAGSKRRGKHTHERALSDAGRPGQSDAVASRSTAAEGGEQGCNERPRLRAAIFDEVERPGDGDTLAGPNAGHERGNARGESFGLEGVS